MANVDSCLTYGHQCCGKMMMNIIEIWYDDGDHDGGDDYD